MNKKTEKIMSKIIPYGYMVLLGMIVIFNAFTEDVVGAIYQLIFVIAIIQITKLGFILNDHIESKK